jgi:hypothetical protein
MKFREIRGLAARRMTVRLLLGAAFVLGLSLSVTAQTMPQGNLADLPSVEQVALSEDSARNSIYAFRDLKVRYGDELPETTDATAWLAEMSRYADLEATVLSYGFDDVAQWHQTLSSFILAYLMGADGKKAEMELAIQQIEASEQMPQTMKDQLVARLSGFIPSDDNVAVAQALAADPEIAALIEEFEE